MRISSIASFTLIIASPAFTQEAGMMGAGSGKCGDYVREYQRDPDVANNVYFSWAQGYMSGLNFEQLALKKRMRNLNALPVASQLDYLMVYCKQKPDELFVMAARNLFNALPPNSK
jgi:hypothetical protein